MAFYRRILTLFVVAVLSTGLFGCGTSVMPVKDPQSELQVKVATPLEFMAVDVFTEGTPGDLTAVPPEQPVAPDITYVTDSVEFTFLNRSLVPTDATSKGANFELLYMDFVYEDRNNTLWPAGTFARPWRQSLAGMMVPADTELTFSVTLVPGWMKTDTGGLIDRLFFGYTNQTLGGSATEGLWFFTSSITSTFFSEPEREAAKMWTAHIKLVYRDSMTGDTFSKDMKVYFGMGPLKASG